MIERLMSQKYFAYIGLGSNLGDRVRNIEEAIINIEKKATIIKKSSLYESNAWGFESESTFLNNVIGIKTDLTPHLLFHYLKEIELEMGRVKLNIHNYEDRIIDLDILFFDNQILSDEIITIPHNQICNRRFVLEPLNEIASEFIHPTNNKTIAELLRECTDMSVLKQIHFKM